MRKVFFLAVLIPLSCKVFAFDTAHLSLKVTADPRQIQISKPSEIKLHAIVEIRSLIPQRFGVTTGCEAILFWKTDNKSVSIDNHEGCFKNSQKIVTLLPGEHHEIDLILRIDSSVQERQISFRVGFTPDILSGSKITKRAQTFWSNEITVEQ